MSLIVWYLVYGEFYKELGSYFSEGVVGLVVLKDFWK